MKQASLQIITNIKGEVLLLKRTDKHKLFPGEWCLPGGKRELPDAWHHPLFENRSVTESDYIESIEETNYRETKEELGLKVYVAQRLPFSLIDDHFECIPFLAVQLVSDDMITQKFPNNEHEGYQWFNPHELPAEIGTMTEILIQRILCSPH